MTWARRILGAPKNTSNDAVLVRLGWMPLYHLLQCRFGCQYDETSLHVLFNCPFVDTQRLIIKKKCNDENIDFNLQKLMTHPSLQMPVERLLLSFLVSRD